MRRNQAVVLSKSTIGSLNFTIIYKHPIRQKPYPLTTYCACSIHQHPIVHPSEIDSSVMAMHT